MAAENRTAVVAAIIANVLITVSKFAAAGLSGSSAMLSEAIHSLVDTGNSGLLLYGMRSSRRAPNAEHPFGHGHELYFWTLLVGILIFAVGGGMSIVTGVQHLLNEVEPEETFWNYAVIAAAAAFESVSWYYGLQAFRAERRGRGVVETIRRSKDPTSFSVLFEDTSALIGLALAFLGIFLSARLEAPWLDGVSSVLIGALLCIAAAVMVYESKGLIVGEGVERKTLEELRAMIRADPAVERVNQLLTMYLGPDDVLLAIELSFRSHTNVHDIRVAVARLKTAIRTRFPRIRRIFLDSASVND